MKQLITYDDNGRISTIYTATEEEVAMTEPDLHILEVDRECCNEKHYVKSGAVCDKRPLTEMNHWVTPLEDGWRITFVRVPRHTRVDWPDGEITEETDGEVVCDVPYPGDYRFQFDPIRYFREEVTVHVAPRD